MFISNILISGSGLYRITLCVLCQQAQKLARLATAFLVYEVTCAL